MYAYFPYNYIIASYSCKISQNLKIDRWKQNHNFCLWCLALIKTTDFQCVSSLEIEMAIYLCQVSASWQRQPCFWLKCPGTG